MRKRARLRLVRVTERRHVLVSGPMITGHQLPVKNSRAVTTRMKHMVRAFAMQPVETWPYLRVPEVPVPLIEAHWNKYQGRHWAMHLKFSKQTRRSGRMTRAAADQKS